METPTETNSKTNYIDNEEMIKQLEIYQQTGEIPEALHMMFWEMANRISHMKNFRRYTYLEDMITTGYARCLRYADRFNLDDEKRNPFAYFTTTIIFSFINFIKKEKKYQRRKWAELGKYVMAMEAEYGITFNYPDDIKNKMFEELISDESKKEKIKE